MTKDNKREGGKKDKKGNITVSGNVDGVVVNVGKKPEEVIKKEDKKKKKIHREKR